MGANGIKLPRELVYDRAGRGVQAIQGVAMMAVCAWNLKKMMEKLIEEVKRLFCFIFFSSLFSKNFYLNIA
jgi:hypothetical protein